MHWFYLRCYLDEMENRISPLDDSPSALDCFHCRDSSTLPKGVSTFFSAKFSEKVSPSVAYRFGIARQKPPPSCPLRCECVDIALNV